MVTNKTILSLESNGKKFSAELNWDAGLEDLMDSFYGLCVCATFNPKNIVEYMNSYSQSMIDANWTTENE
jgi:hypothetical protein